MVEIVCIGQKSFLEGVDILSNEPSYKEYNILQYYLLASYYLYVVEAIRSCLSHHILSF